jgi:hypothetical protein
MENFEIVLASKSGSKKRNYMEKKRTDNLAKVSL